MSESTPNPLWDAVAERVGGMDLSDFRLVYSSRRTTRYVQLVPRYVMDGNRAIYYQWRVSKRELEVALHFDFAEEKVGQRYLDRFGSHEAAIRKSVRHPYKAECPAGESARMSFTVPFNPADPAAVAPEAVRVMALLVARTWPVLEATLPRDRSVV